MATTRYSGPEPPKGASADEIEAHIEHTREELGDTVEALSHKFDVKAQAQEKVAQAKGKADIMADRVRESSPRPKALLAALGAAAAAVAGVIAWRRKR